MKPFTIRPLTHLFGCLVCCMLLVACQSESDNAPEVDAVPKGKRLVTAGPALTSTVLQLGAGAQLLGTDLSSRSLAGLDSSVKDLGYNRMLSAEGILAMKPDVVLLSDAAGPASTVEALKQAGIAVTIIPEAKTPEAGLALIQQVAKALALPADSLLARYDAALKAPASATPQRVLVLFARGSADKLFALGTDTPAAALLKQAGHTIVSDFTGTKPLNIEALIATQPQWVVLPTDPHSGLATLAAVQAHPQLGKLAAVKAGKVLLLPQVALFGFGPDTPAALEALRALK
jgi:iron complex transport system substrate-binding protein